MKRVLIDKVVSKEDLITRVYNGISEELNNWAEKNWDAFEEIIRSLNDYLPNEKIVILNKDLSLLSKQDLFLYEDILFNAIQYYKQKGMPDKVSVYII
ncbi:MAG: hypothetical protein IKP91_08215 [Bacteroidaceae bacterium]|nr:hypothetical protein [Bacteroidaceae bacterium]